MRIGEFFVKKKYITPEELEMDLSKQAIFTEIPLGEILVRLGVVPKENLVKYVSEFIEVNAKENLK